MKRHNDLSPREDFANRLRERGFEINPDDPYWMETSAYEFTEEEIDTLDDVAVEMHALCVEAAHYVIDRDLFYKFGVPEDWKHYLVKTIDRDDPHIYGRFDFVFDGQRPPKLLEYNADTPTGLLEASVLQWDWLEDRRLPDQFNFIHEALVARWKAEDVRVGIPRPLYFTCDQDSGEDWVTTTYLRDACEQAGIDTRDINIVDIALGHDENGQECFIDPSTMEKIQAAFKLYPWEFMARDEFGRNALKDHTGFIEPAWKMLWSNKALLPILWEIAPNHPNLLEAHFTKDAFEAAAQPYVKKALFGREGASVEIVHPDPAHAEKSEGEYGREGYVYQEYCEMPQFQGQYPVCGVWIVGDKAVGLGIREDSTRITRNTSNFVPHFFKPR